jgi:hypothetical protein
MHSTAPSQLPGLPLVVHLSFAGSRMLLDATKHPRVDRGEFEDRVERWLRERIVKLRAELGLSERHFWCGISQIAIGGDTVFTRACRDLAIPQRIYLPQQREDFLKAASKSGQPDFSPDEERVARELLESSHIIQERAIATADDRQARFEEVNRELARLANVVLCLIRADAEPKPGGSLDLVKQAAKRGRPALEIRVSVGVDGQPQFAETWHQRESFKLPALPHELHDLKSDLPATVALGPYCAALQGFAEHQARGTQAIFRYAALTIVVTHFLATLCAVLALWKETAPVAWLLGAELLLLAIGLATHQALHGKHASAVWGMTRLVAEVARSALPLAAVKTHSGHLFTLPMPDGLRPLLRTLSVLHLRESHRLSADTLSARRDQYIRERLTDEAQGQIPYYRGKLSSAQFWRRAANVLFLAGSILAFAATAFKLLLHDWSTANLGELNREELMHWLGSAAILLPVVAVAALSLAASLDLEARASTYRELLDYLVKHCRLLEQAASDREFAELATEAETRLLGETVTWYFRRSYTSVA